ncbi:MAG: tRNA (5-methylaminomethyl-2-thiouridylate)-methyltransferase, tRNA-specific 2-thiouridylase [Patescibacteria group bacterium]|nr:tRNA (5-methylaminomethyl-2-thiouridylate)-methyltransferase, tRNA-specific 2-thiouridylase [Patescibacteria group bacterium]
MFSWFLKKNKIGKGKKAFVGVSGGVDSSVSAALLIEQGYDVVGVFIRTWQPDWIPCTWKDERRDAMRVCAHLNIPFVELDLEQEYKKGVADYMIAEYKSGRTPNPDVMCNREVKFGGFLNWALEHGADHVATGHYARNDGQLMKGVDPSKDQSYFLWMLTKEQLSKILFPIGHLEKSDVRKLAEKFKLPTATKKDSQGICFIGEIDMKEFLRHYIDINPGDVLNIDGEKIGTHDGSLFYTLGERHGFVISKKTTRDMPYYVVEKNIDKNTITVSQDPASFENSTDVILRDCVWREKIISDKKYDAQIRYHGHLKPGILVQGVQGEWIVHFDESDFSLSPGQSVVVYDGDVCVGGGIVK